MSVTVIGESKAFNDMVALVKKISPAKTNVLVVGESGTGKELVARMLHEWGPLKGKPFVPVNCGAIPENLIESELFGHKRGSFTGAVSDKPGLFEVATGGSLFLDEIGELPLPMQVKLLRALQERTIRKVGATDDTKIDVRIIAATNRDLEAAIAKGTFREDLYYRLNVIQVRTPPLRERTGDVPILALHFLKKFTSKFHKALEGFDSEALVALQNHSWPGNVRELENTIERAVALETGSRISLQVLPPQLRTSVEMIEGGGSKDAPRAALHVPAPSFARGPIDLEAILGEVERVYLLAALEHTHGVRKKAAQMLGITFRSIRYRLKKLGIDPNEGPNDGPDEDES